MGEDQIWCLDRNQPITQDFEDFMGGLWISY